MRYYSNDIIVDADQELEDLEPSAGGLIYQFVAEGKEFTRARIEGFMEENGIDSDKWDSVLQFLLYYGFFGVGKAGNVSRYIYDVGYDTKKLRALSKKAGGSIRFTLNPVFWPGLGSE